MRKKIVASRCTAVHVFSEQVVAGLDLVAIRDLVWRTVIKTCVICAQHYDRSSQHRIRLLCCTPKWRWVARRGGFRTPQCQSKDENTVPVAHSAHNPGFVCSFHYKFLKQCRCTISMWAVLLCIALSRNDVGSGFPVISHANTQYILGRWFLSSNCWGPLWLTLEKCIRRWLDADKTVLQVRSSLSRCR